VWELVSKPTNRVAVDADPLKKYEEA